MSPATARIVPTLHQSRAGISLYDAQYSSAGERIPIPEEAILAVLRALIGFKRTCQDYGVPDSNVTFIATEATRTAVNSIEFRQRIKEITGWEVTMLPKEEEGRVGAMGVVSSLGEVNGIIMDLGGGSTQLTWIISHGKTGLRMPEQGAVSMPFGAAALTRGLSEADKKGHGARQQFAEEIRTKIKDAYTSLQVPQELDDLARTEGGFALYLSGGGFRGWGFVLMNQHPVKPYPISVINGFKASRDDFMDTASIQITVTAQKSKKEDIFRVSERRASQVPAVAFLVNALSSALPQIKEVRFCQGGVREGHLFSSLSPEIQGQHPLEVATLPHATASSPLFRKLLSVALLPGPPKYATSAMKTSDPTDTAPSPEGTNGPSYINSATVTALSNLLTYHSTHPRDIRAAAALRSTTTGFMASVHGLSHEDRAILALLLCERWGGVKELPKSETRFYESLMALLPDPWTRWWIIYFGRVAALVGSVYPAGVAREEILAFDPRWSQSFYAVGKHMLVLGVKLILPQETRLMSGQMHPDAFASEFAALEKVGKRKHWVGGPDGIGHRFISGLEFI